MSSLDVRMGLRLDYDGREAKQAKKDIKALVKAAERLNGRRADGLSKDLGKVKVYARKAGDALKIPAARMKDINRVRTDRAEKELKDLSRSADRAARSLQKVDNVRFNRIRKEADKAQRRLDRLRGKINEHGKLKEPVSVLSRGMGFLKSQAGGAFAAVAAFASVDNIVRGLNQLQDSFNELDDAAARVAVTAELLDPAVVENIKSNNNTVALRYGQKPAEVNSARDVYAAANYKVDRQNALLDPTAKAAFASGAEPEIIARAVLSGMNSLGIKENQVPAFLDQIVKGGKEGEFEIEAMARYFPEMGALYAASGRSGLEASAELISLAQITRKGAGMEAGAATNLQNFLSKMAAPDTVKNFKEKGVNLKKLAAKAQATDTPYVLALLDKIEAMTGGDEFKIGELFGDMQAKAALRPLLANRELYKTTYDAIKNQSAGVVDKDADFLMDTKKAKADRRAAALAQSGRVAGNVWGTIKEPVVDGLTRTLNPEYRRMEDKRATEKRLKGVDLEVLIADMADLQEQIASRPQMNFGMPDVQKQTLETDLRNLKFQYEEAGKFKGIQIPERLMQPDFDIKSLMPDPQEFGQIGQKAGAEFAGALKAEAGTAAAIADELKARFSFTATPTIKPSFSSPGQGLSPQKMSAPGPTTFNSTINGSRDPERVARLITRQQNRQYKAANARALHDTGALA